MILYDSLPFHVDNADAEFNMTWQLKDPNPISPKIKNKLDLQTCSLIFGIGNEAVPGSDF